LHARLPAPPPAAAGNANNLVRQNKNTTTELTLL